MFNDQWMVLSAFLFIPAVMIPVEASDKDPGLPRLWVKVASRLSRPAQSLQTRPSTRIRKRNTVCRVLAVCAKAGFLPPQAVQVSSFRLPLHTSRFSSFYSKCVSLTVAENECAIFWSRGTAAPLSGKRRTNQFLVS